MEARIADLQQLLKNAVVGESPQDDGVVEPGMVVTISMARKERTFLLGNREIAEGTDLEVFSTESPLGSAIHGAKVGETVDYRSEEHTSELQSRGHLVCRLLLEQKKTT